MMEPIIEIQGIGKKYDINHQRGGYIALRDVLAYMLKRPFSFFKAKAKRAIGFDKKEEFWALRDVSFNVGKGEVVGVIGRNGAGKSTLLKILTGITPPTEGRAVMRGRVASLLEVGTGFHPELTGRENIFLNGAIIGMTRREIARKFDDIVAFSGIEKFLDTPVKHYSSGMYVRLAFSVAAHMEPDVLIVDEVLAVGDAEFQKKCLGKMEEVTRSDGRTILFVSHNMAAVAALCKKVVVLEHGKVVFYGPTSEAIDFYLNRFALASSHEPASLELDHGAVRFSSFTFNGTPSEQSPHIASGEPLTIGVRVESKDPSGTLNIAYSIRRRSDGVMVVFSHAELEGVRLTSASGIVEATFDMPRLAPGDYILEFSTKLNDVSGVGEKEIGFFTVPETRAFKGEQTFREFPSVVMADSSWHSKPLS
ncbi:MAG TPA: ABC transporter ATP-binding protein [Candidatus Paceibacterota bacterium]|nr:ABC transporter ATP-binding protein [Candidatus Paceibacterota bacterium]